MQLFNSLKPFAKSLQALPGIFWCISKFQHFKWLNIASKTTQYKKPIIYLGKKIPSSEGLVHGGAVKLQVLKNKFEISKTRCNIIYLASSSLPLFADKLIRIAKRRGVKIVWNQNGVSYPASMPKKWKQINEVFKQLIHQADYVIYQSEFCKKSSDEFLGKFKGPSEIVYNCVDTDFFKPHNKNQKTHPLTLLLGGNQYKKYRIETALYTLAEVKKTIPEARMIITGTIQWENKTPGLCQKQTVEIIDRLGLKNAVEFTGPYSQKDAPQIYNRADILLHTKWRDPCPGLVIEAMACGLPVVYSSSGGVPELVSKECGLGIKADGDWENIDPPNPKELFKAILHVCKTLHKYSTFSRKRAVEYFNISSFINKHKEIFSSVLNA